jgi:TolB-like protein
MRGKVLFLFEDQALDPARRELRRGSTVVPVEPQVFDLLLYLIDNRDRVVSKDDLIASVWNGRIVSESTLTSRINAARRALGDNGKDQRLVRTAARRGIRFVGVVRESPGPLPADGTTAKADSAPKPPLRQEIAGSAREMDEGLDRALPRQPSVAVMPFVALGDEPHQQIIADGLTLDLITRLSRMRWLFVIDRGTTFAMRRSLAGAYDIGRVLGVRYVARGTARFFGKRLRVSAALTEASASAEIWADQFDYSMDDVFAVQDQVSIAIAGAVGSEIEYAEQRRALKIPWERLDAWTAYNRGCWHMYRFTRQDYEEAERFFSLAARLEPSAPRAFAGLSFVHWQRAFLGVSADRKGEIRRATEFAQHSLSLDPRDPQGHWALGRGFLIQGDTKQAIEELEHCVSLGPSFALGHYSLGYALVSDGQNSRGAARTESAERLSPFDPMRFAFWGARACALALLGKVGEAGDLAAKAARQPNAHHHLLALAAWCLASAGRHAEAGDCIARVRRARPDYTIADYFRSFPIRHKNHQALVRRAFGQLGVRN